MPVTTIYTAGLGSRRSSRTSTFLSLPDEGTLPHRKLLVTRILIINDKFLFKAPTTLHTLGYSTVYNKPRFINWKYTKNHVTNFCSLVLLRPVHYPFLVILLPPLVVGYANQSSTTDKDTRIANNHSSPHPQTGS
jgi:hypothetical protein